MAAFVVETLLPPTRRGFLLEIANCSQAAMLDERRALLHHVQDILKPSRCDYDDDVTNPSTMTSLTPLL